MTNTAASLRPAANDDPPILVSPPDQDNQNAITDVLDDDRPLLVVVSGPTAVGKTDLGIHLAEHLHGEVVNADSRYLYRHLEIGVAKPTLMERRGVPHHLIDVLDPDETMTLTRYQDLAMAAIAQIHHAGALPIMVGGTPLYINAVVEGWRIPRVPPDVDFRAAREAEVAEGRLPELMAQLESVDPVAAARSGTNARRIIRALEIYHATGQPMSALEGKGPHPFRTIEIGLTMPRDRLHRAIDARVDDNIRRGLVEEVRNLLDAGIDPDGPAMSSLGYRQLLPYLHGAKELQAAVATIKVDTHRFVRHQETWFRKNPRLIRLDVTQEGWKEKALALAQNFANTR